MLPEGSEGMLLDLMTRFKVMILPCIILTVYCLFAWKWLPNKKFDSSKLEGKGGKKKEKDPAAQMAGEPDPRPVPRCHDLPVLQQAAG